MQFSVKEKAEEIRRELNMRRAVFTRLMANGSLKPKDAERRIAIMEAVLADYSELAEAQDALERLL